MERYVRDSSAFFVEFLVTDDGVRLTGDGELLSAPYAVGQIMPSQGLEPEVLDQIVEGGRKLAEALRAIGYRGILGPDTIVTPNARCCSPSTTAGSPGPPTSTAGSAGSWWATASARTGSSWNACGPRDGPRPPSPPPATPSTGPGCPTTQPPGPAWCSPTPSTTATASCTASSRRT
ncbi:hypothetical protein NKH77_55005 [Streptomyces sp. M19]